MMTKILEIYSHNWGTTLAFALGIWAGNWLINPFIVKTHTFTDGFFVGMIAAVLFFVCYPLIMNWLQKNTPNS